MTKGFEPSVAKPSDCGILWSVRVQVAESESEARAKEAHYLDALPKEAGLIELSSMYGVDFSSFHNAMTLIDIADEVRSQNVHWGSFEELLKTTDPSQTIGEFARRFMTDRVLVAAGTPKQVADMLEEWHFETGANGGFMLGERLFRARQSARVCGSCRA